jgi:hypothetical protein
MQDNMFGVGVGWENLLVAQSWFSAALQYEIWGGAGLGLNQRLIGMGLVVRQSELPW